MNRTLQIGTEVVLVERYHPFIGDGTKKNPLRRNKLVLEETKRYGTIVESNEDGSRKRIKWSHWVYPSGNIKLDTKRTWIKSDRLRIVPTLTDAAKYLPELV